MSAGANHLGLIGLTREEEATLVALRETEGLTGIHMHWLNAAVQAPTVGAVAKDERIASLERERAELMQALDEAAAENGALEAERTRLESDASLLLDTVAAERERVAVAVAACDRAEAEVAAGAAEGRAAAVRRDTKAATAAEVRAAEAATAVAVAAAAAASAAASAAAREEEMAAHLEEMARQLDEARAAAAPASQREQALAAELHDLEERARGLAEAAVWATHESDEPGEQGEDLTMRSRSTPAGYPPARRSPPSGKKGFGSVGGVRTRAGKLASGAKAGAVILLRGGRAAGDVGSR